MTFHRHDLWLVSPSQFDRVPEPLYKRLQSHVSETGSTQTEAVLAAMVFYFGADNMVSLVERVSQLERRLNALEQG